MLFILSKTLFSFLKYTDFCPDFFSHVEKELGLRKLLLISIFKTSQPGKQFKIHVLLYPIYRQLKATGE